MAKEKFKIEFGLSKVSLNLLWNSISTASGLEDWFADNVNVRDKIFTFKWKDSSQDAEQVSMRTGQFIRFRWLEDEDKSYFEFKITIDEITQEVSLLITDFAEPEDIDDAKNLWNKQINDLRHSVGL